MARAGSNVAHCRAAIMTAGAHEAAAQILAAWRNEHRPPITRGAKIRAAIEHARQSPLRLMLELERRRRVQQQRERKP
jgi:hypothetical protein